MDQFPEKRPEIKTLNGVIDIEPVRDIIAQVFQFLMVKAIHESRKQDKYNQTHLGNVSFYISYNDISKETKLSFDKHPKVWDIKGIISDMQNMEVDIMMDQQATTDAWDNPFTY